MKYTIDSCAIYLRNRHNEQAFGPVDDLFESASTIKIPVLIMACEHNQRAGHTLAHTVRRLAHHASNGSGYLEWSGKTGERYTIRRLIYYMMVFSDCVATNMLIDYVGGKRAINQWLEKQGYATRILLAPINFASENATEPVGVTTAREVCMLFHAATNNDWNNAYKGLVRAATSEPAVTWVGHKLAHHFPDMQLKTGSMINCLPTGETTINIAGCINDKPGTYFGVCSVGHVESDEAAELMRDEVMSTLTKMITEGHANE